MRLRNGCRNGGELLKLKEGPERWGLPRIRIQMRGHCASAPGGASNEKERLQDAF